TRRPLPPPPFPYTTLFRSWTKRLAERPRLQFLWHMGLALCGLVLFFTAIEPLVYSDAFWWIFVYSLPVLIGLLIWFLRRVYRRRSEEHTSELQSRENLVCR